MRTLIVGIGALGGVVGARLLASGMEISLATRDDSTATELRVKGLKVSGIGGDVEVRAPRVASLGSYDRKGEFDLILLATKARDAIAIAPTLLDLLARDGVLLPIQNGGVPSMLAEKLGDVHVLGGLSNLGATMVGAGDYVQRNAGYLLVGEVAGGMSERASRVCNWLGRSVNVKSTDNLRGSIWSKLLLNCSVTTVGALAGSTMLDYIQRSNGRALFQLVYDEALSVALGSGNVPERMIVDPIPPSREDARGREYEEWLAEILKNYGSLKPSMLQDIEKKRPTEIDFINGYVCDVGRAHGIAVSVNGAMVDVIRDISNGIVHPGSENLERVLRDSGKRNILA